MTTALSFNAERHVQPDRAQHLYTVRRDIGAQVAEVTACLSNEHLVPVWLTELNALAATLAARVTAADEKIAAYEASIPPLEVAIENEAEARDAYELAKLARAQGSLDRKTSLKLRDDLEVADSALFVRRRELADSAQRANAFIPRNGAIPQIMGREFVEALATHVLNVTFNPGRDLFNRAGWIDGLTEDELAGVPVYAARTIVEALKEKKKHKIFYQGLELDDRRREAIVLPVPEFVAALAEFKHQREAHIRSKAVQAQRALEAAQAHVAAFAGAQS